MIADMLRRQDVEHLILHGLIAIIDSPASLGFALFNELGDELKHRRNPDRHTGGFSLRDFVTRAIIPTVLLLLGWKGVLFQLF